MKKLIFTPTLFVVLAFLVTGCFLKSVHPLVEQENGILVDGVTGIWADEEQRWTFIGRGDTRQEFHDKFSDSLLGELEISYEDLRDDEFATGYVVIYESLKTPTPEKRYFFGHMISLENNIYLDLFPVELWGGSGLYSNHFVPVHTFSKIDISSSRLDIKIFKDSWIKEQIVNHRVRIKHEKTGEDGDDILITASTPELQKFVEKYGDLEEAFEDPISLNRSR